MTSKNYLRTGRYTREGLDRETSDLNSRSLMRLTRAVKILILTLATSCPTCHHNNSLIKTPHSEPADNGFSPIAHLMQYLILRVKMNLKTIETQEQTRTSGMRHLQFRLKAGLNPIPTRSRNQASNPVPRSTPKSRNHPRRWWRYLKSFRNEAT